MPFVEPTWLALNEDVHAFRYTIFFLHCHPNYRFGVFACVCGWVSVKERRSEKVYVHERCVPLDGAVADLPMMVFLSWEMVSVLALGRCKSVHR